MRVIGGTARPLPFCRVGPTPSLRAPQGICGKIAVDRFNLKRRYHLLPLPLCGCHSLGVLANRYLEMCYRLYFKSIEKLAVLLLPRIFFVFTGVEFIPFELLSERREPVVANSGIRGGLCAWISPMQTQRNLAAIVISPNKP